MRVLIELDLIFLDVPVKTSPKQPYEESSERSQNCEL